MMDTDLYQAISLGLMGLVVILLLALMSMLAKLRKRLEEDQVSTRRAEARPAASAAAEPAGEPSPRQEHAAAAAEAPSQSAAAETAAEPAAGQRAATAKRAAAEPAASATPEPEEQPFERDGRWWYRRGDELLVYDEQTGQWTQASATESGEASAPQAAQEAAPAQTQADAFWKCPSCGAINGSTATTCRMCFAARP